MEGNSFVKRKAETAEEHLKLGTSKKKNSTKHEKISISAEDSKFIR